MLCNAIYCTRQAAIDPSSGPSNEIICILPAQGAAKLQKVKFEGPKNVSFFSGREDIYMFSYSKNFSSGALLYFSDLQI